VSQFLIDVVDVSFKELQIHQRHPHEASIYRIEVLTRAAIAPGSVAPSASACSIRCALTDAE